MLICPNKNTPEWRLLASELGEVDAYRVFIANGDSLPEMIEILPLIEQVRGRDALEQRLTESVEDFLSKIGVDVKTVDKVTDKEGNPLSALAKADLLNSVIEIAKGHKDLSNLSEEAAHFLVEMLGEEHPLFKAMYKNVVNFPVYDEVVRLYGEVYKNDELRLRKEAMGKMISQVITGELKDERAKTLFQKVWNVISKLLLKAVPEFTSTLSILKGNPAPFFEAANKILTGNTIGLKKTDSTEEYYNLDPADALYDALKQSNNSGAIEKVTTGDKDEYRVNGKPVKTRVTDIAKSQQKSKNRNYTETKTDILSRETGTKIHAIVQNVVDRVFNPSIGYTYYESLPIESKAIYDKLKNPFIRFAKKIKEQDPKARILTEVMVYDDSRDVAGTIDLLVVWGDGSVSIYDYKTTKNDEIHPFKLKEYDVQLTEYKKILKKGSRILGIPPVTAFRSTRILPIHVSFNFGRLTDVSVNEGKEIETIPVANEMTGDNKLDELLGKLISKVEELEKKKLPSDQQKREIQIERINKLRKTIQNLQLTKTVDSVLEDAEFELAVIGDLAQRLKDGAEITDDVRRELENAVYMTELYTELKEFIPDEQLKDKNFKNRLDTIRINAIDLKSDVEELIEKSVGNLGQALGIGTEADILAPQKETTLLSKWFRSLSQINHPIFRTFYKLVKQALRQTRDDSTILKNKIESALDDLKQWGSERGLTGIDIFEPLLQFKEGKWTGNLLSKYSPEFYEERDRARADLDDAWFQKNVKLDIEKYKAEREKYFDIISKVKYGKTDADSEVIRQKKRDDWDNRQGNIRTSDYVIIDQRWESPQWKNLHAPGNEALLNFYNLFTGTMKEFNEFLPDKFRPNFIPNIRKNLIESIATNGIEAVGGMKENFMNSMEVQQNDTTLGVFNSITGEREYSVPLYYTTQLNPEEKSHDLGKVLYLFGEMAYNFKYMSDIESNVRLLRHTLSNQEQILVGADGRPVRNKITEEARKAIGSSSTLEQFTDFMNYYLYGVTNKQQWLVHKNDKTYSLSKFFINALSYTSAKALGLNLLSGTANLFGGMSNAFIQGARGKYYNDKMMMRSLYDLSSKNERAYDMIEQFSVMMDDERYRNANQLSASSLTKNVSLDKLYFQQRGGDFIVQNGILLSMLQSHTLVDGKIVSIKDQARKTVPGYYSLSREERKEADVKIKEAEQSFVSLYNMDYTLENNKLKFGETELSSEEVDSFRTKVQAVSKNVMGNTSREDINTVKLTIFGKALMQFRNWIPRTVDERFGELRYNQDLDTYELGRYRTFWNHLMSKQVLEQIKHLNFSFISDPISRAKELYQEHLKANPDSKISEEEFIQLHLENLRATMRGVAVTFGVLAIIIGTTGGDDDDVPGGKKAAVKVLNRLYDELTFYSNPISFLSILKSPIPLISPLTDAYMLAKHGFNQTAGVVTGDEKEQKEATPTKYAFKLIPGLAESYRISSLMTE